jgi:hypothetical protein
MPRVDVVVKVNPRARKEVRRRSTILVRRVLRAIVAEMKRVVSTPYPPASDPFDPPHLRKGGLRASIHEVVDEASGGGGVVVSDPKAGYLEAGTGRMKRRPFALVTARRVIKWFQSGSFTSVRNIPED